MQEAPARMIHLLTINSGGSRTWWKGRRHRGCGLWSPHRVFGRHFQAFNTTHL